MPENTQLGRRLRTLRAIKGLTQEEMAQRMGFKHSPVISKIESGDRKLSALELARWCKECGVTTDAVLSGTLSSVPLDAPSENEVAS